MKTYNQTYRKELGEKEDCLTTFFDWPKFLSKRNKTEEDWRVARLKSGSWVTCACGNQCDAIPRYDEGAPKDAKLNDLGMSFMYKIRVKDTKVAKIVLKEIEKRSIEILTEMGIPVN